MTMPIERESVAADSLALIAEIAFLRDLPENLRNHAGEWIAYHGERVIGFSTTKSALYQQCREMGFDENGFEVRCIEPQVEETTIGPGELV